MDRRFLQSVVFGGHDPSNTQPEDVGSRPEGQEFPVIVPLPHHVVDIFELAWENNLDMETFHLWLADFRAALSEKSTYLLHQAEERALLEANEKCHLMTRALESGEIEEAIEEALLLFRSLNVFEMMRAGNRQCELGAVNELLLAGLSNLEGRAESEIVLGKVDMAAQELDQMVELYKLGEEHLPSEVKAAFLVGIQRSGDGLQKVRAWVELDESQKRATLHSLANGAGLLAQLESWKKQSDLECLGAVPVVGERVQSMLLRMEQGQALPEEDLSAWEQSDYPSLLEFWESTRGSILVATKYRVTLLAQVNQELERLQTLSELPMVQQRISLSNLDRSFEQLAERHLDLSSLDDHPYRWRADLFLSILAGGIPTFYLWKTVERFVEQGDTECAEALKEYLESGDGGALISLLERELSLAH